MTANLTRYEVLDGSSDGQGHLMFEICEQPDGDIKLWWMVRVTVTVREGFIRSQKMLFSVGRQFGGVDAPQWVEEIVQLVFR